MPDVKYFIRRKQNKLSLISFYIIFILFIDKLRLLFCYPVDFCELFRENCNGGTKFEKEREKERENEIEIERENKRENEREKERENEKNKNIEENVEVAISIDRPFNPECIYNKLKTELIPNYDKTESNYLKIETNNSYSFQLTTVNNQMDYLINNIKSEFSVIDLKECTKKLNKENGRDEDADLILLKYENENQVDVNQKSIQYEIYNPETNNKLDLSVCSDIKIDIYIPIQLSKETKELYKELNRKGFNLFDKNNKFYTDICTPYQSKFGTDVLLSDRCNDFFIPNQLNCQANCEYSDYLPDSEYLKCECNVVNEEKIDTREPEKVTAKSIVKPFYNTLKYSNYKILKCYKLVFRKRTLYKNKGSFLSLIYLLGFFIAFIIFCFRRFIYITKEINKLYEKIEKNKDININETTNAHKSKKIKSKKHRNKNKSKNNNKSNNIQFNNRSSNLILKKTLHQKENYLEVKNQKILSDYSDYELNDLEYASAIEHDNRSFFKIYFYYLKREHIILFTFFNYNDFNIFSVKLSKFFLAICTNMAFNIFFFSDESTHNIYISEGEYDFIGQLAQMIYSTIVSQLLQVFINYLTMTDITYYSIKELIKEKKININQIQSKMRYLKFKIIIFFIFAFCLFLFFWYLISAFCSVYENTQRIFIIDSISSFVMELIYPFGLYLIPTGLRILALKSKNIKFIYTLSDKIPFF